MYALSFLLSCSCSLYESTTSRCVPGARVVSEVTLRKGNFLGSEAFPMRKPQSGNTARHRAIAKQLSRQGSTSFPPRANANVVKRPSSSTSSGGYIQSSLRDGHGAAKEVVKVLSEEVK